MGEGAVKSIVARWHARERALETGLDPRIVRRLDELREQHARLVARYLAVAATTPPPATVRPEAAGRTVAPRERPAASQE
jgi:hypothetical protein